MKKPAATRQKEKTEIEQLSQAELVQMVLALQKIIEELQDKLAIATGNIVSLDDFLDLEQS